VTRIIAGSAGGRRLTTPPGDATRPTSDRVREAVFSALESALGTWSGLRFLDLFAGSGAVGLEAVSRGAAHATLVEQHRRAAGIARSNARALGLVDVDVVQARAEAFVRRSGDTGSHTGPDGSPDTGPDTGPAACFDVVFLDPPYTLSTAAVSALLADLVHHGWLCPGAVVVVERSSRDPEPAWPDGITPVRSRRYGETVVWYGRAT
jgi:16S rRNA (guanine966-N2)-methyltransferase